MKHIQTFESTIEEPKFKKYAVLHIKLFNMSAIRLIYIIKNLKDCVWDDSYIFEELYEHNPKSEKIIKLNKKSSLKQITTIESLEKYTIYQSDDLKDCYNYLEAYIKSTKYNL